MSTAVASIVPAGRESEDSSVSVPAPTHAESQWRNVALILLWPVLIVTPCWWQPHIQAVDLPSHLYNAWLANQIVAHPVSGLVVARQSTNVLFDWMLRSLLRVGSPETAERVAVSIAVLVFFWGAFAFVAVTSKRRSWAMAPCLAMLAYGWVFHMGFFNFYLSMGLSLCVMAMVWRPSLKRWLLAAPVLLLACLAHDLPVLWAISVIAYLYASRLCSGAGRRLLPVAAILALVIGFAVVRHAYVTLWSPQQLGGMLGIDQVWVFGRKYYLLALGLLLVWTPLFVRRVDFSLLESRFGIPLDLVALNSLAIVLIPTHLELPFYKAPLNFLAPRMSLAAAVLICAFIAAHATLRHGVAFAVLAALFFSFVFVDTREMNRIEARVDVALADVPAGSRVINGILGLTNRMLILTHLADRASIGRFWSYSNYEPSTGQFSLRATAPNPVVLSDPRDVSDVQDGHYIVQQRDLPLFQVTLCGPENRVCVHSLEAGERARVIKSEILPPLWASQGMRIIP